MNKHEALSQRRWYVVDAQGKILGRLATEIAKVLRDLFVLKGDKELSFGERKMLDTARNLLVKELSIARSHSEEKIMEELRHIFTH